MELSGVRLDHQTKLKNLQFDEERFRIIIEQTGQIVYDYDVSSGKIYWAGAIKALTGFTSEEFAEFGLEEWENKIHPDDREMVVNCLAACEKTGAPFDAVYRFQRKDGTYIYLEDHGVFVSELGQGERSRLLGSMSDITARVESQEALKRSERLYRSLVEATSHMVWMADAEGNALMDLRAWAAFTGQSLDELEGLGWTNAIHPEDMTEVMDRWKNCLQSGDVYLCEYRLKRRDGVYRLMSAKAVPVRDAKEEISSWIGTCQDIHEQRELEKRESMLEAQLRQSQKMEAIGTLAGGVAHDFNNILMAIMAYAELAQEDASGNLQLQGNIGPILESAQRARDLVRQILSFSRQNQVETRAVQLDGVVEDALKFLKAAFSSQIEIKMQCVRPLPAILADPIQMQQVVMNLCTNSAQALKEMTGSIKIFLEVVQLDEPSAEKVHLLNAGSYVLLRVEDSGTGMDEETCKRIFEPFFTTKPPGEGTGLGLSVVHGIVKAHQGSIQVRSHVGQGTIFDLYFPVAYGVEQKINAAETTLPRGRGQRILVVDDEVKIAKSLSLILERLGYHTEFFLRPLHALKLIEKDPWAWDMVITDLTMPGLTGIQLAEKIRNVREDLPILLITGYSGSWTKEQLQEKGILEMMSKPVLTQKLAVVVERNLGT
jgi:PAS domain S-box-containing protein